MRILWFFDFQVIYVLGWWFHFRNEIPFNDLFTRWKCTYILDLRPCRWSALDMRLVVKQPSRMQEQCFFFVFGQGRQLFWGKFKKIPGGAKIFAGGLPPPESDIPKSSWGDFNVPCEHPPSLAHDLQNFIGSLHRSCLWDPTSRKHDQVCSWYITSGSNIHPFRSWMQDLNPQDFHF